MASYEIVEHAKGEVTYLAYLILNCRVHEKSFEKWKNDYDLKEIEKYKRLMDQWVECSMIKIP